MKALNWFRWTIWHPIRTWVPAKIFQLRHGFDYRDCWNLDHAMAKWLVPRLRHMAKVTHSYPGVGPYANDQGYVNWLTDLARVANSLDEYLKYEDSEPWDTWEFNESKRLHKEAHQSIEWIATWWRHLWD